MTALVLCGLAFGLCYFAGRRSLVEGIAAALGVGYVYGIVRANVPSAFSHFLFDSGVLGLYAAQLFRPLDAVDRARIKPLMPWLLLLIGWPALLVLLPLQDPLVRLVGLRAHIYFLPFLFLGARLHRDDLVRLAYWLAAFNIAVFGVAVAEFFIGVEPFFPRNDVTELIYRSRDIHTTTSLGSFRIPATFSNAALYGGTMVISLPLLVGLWTQPGSIGKRAKLFLLAAILASSLGVFLAATRMNILALGVIVAATILSGRLGVGGRLAALSVIGLVAVVVSMEERLFRRILTLNLDTIVERMSWSFNSSLWHFTFEFPLGNGLGGGGTSIPYFLLHLIRNVKRIENQFGTILLEQGVPGLFIWLLFVAWMLTRRTTRHDDPWYFGRQVLWLTVAAYFAQAMFGQGLFTAVPFSAVLLLMVGWLVVRQRDEMPSREASQRPLDARVVPSVGRPISVSP